MSIRAKVIHISDLHFGWKYWPAHFSEQLANHLIDDILLRQPQLIICTGDVVNSPLAFRALRRAKEFFERLRKACSTESNACDLLLVPGNHDCALLGIFGIKALTSLPFKSVMKPYLLTCDQPYYNEHLNIAVFGLDSNPAIASFARGDVSDADIKKFAHAVQELRSAKGVRLSNAFKIVALHHHPTAIPYSGSDVLLVLNNAGSLLVELAKRGIDLVLHGHKHYSAFSKTSFLYDGIDYEIPVLAAGSATKIGDNEPRGNSYNLITIFSDNTVEAQTFFARGRGTFVASQGSSFACQSADVANRKSFVTAREVFGWEISSLETHIKINEFGDAFYSVDVSELQVVDSVTLDHVKLQQRVEFGYFRDFDLEAESSTIGLAGSVANTAYTRNEDTKSGVTWTTAECEIRFGSQITPQSEAIDFRVTFPVYAAFAMNTAEQQQRKAVHVPGTEGFDVLNSYPVRELVVIVEAETDLFAPGRIRLAIFDDRGVRETRAEPAQYSNLGVEPRRIEWKIFYPRVGYRYEVRWQIAQLDDGTEESAVHEAIALRGALVRGMTKGAASKLCQTVAPLLEQLRSEFKQQFGSWEPSEIIDISVMVFDEKQGKLRVAAGLFPPESPVWTWAGFSPGFGLGGRALKSNLCVHYFRGARGGVARDVYISPDEPLAAGMDLAEHEVLISAPLHLIGGSRHHIVAIFNAGTTGAASPLYNLISKSEEDSRKMKEKLDAWIQAVENTLVPCLLELAASSKGE